MTKPESIFLERLNKEKIKYCVKPLKNICIPDFIIEDIKLAGFVDGDYQHNIPKILEKDRRVEKKLEEKNWKFIRFWEHEIYKDLDSCIKKLKDEIVRHSK